MNRILDVYLHNQLAGKLIQETSGQLTFQYTEDYLHSSKSMAISLSLPLGPDVYEGGKVRAFFSGLLPDDMARHRLAQYLGLSETNPFGLLEVIGGECAGALAIYPEGQLPPSPKAEDVEKLDHNQLKEILELLKRRPLIAGGDNIRLSLAGAQDKIAVNLAEGAVALVKGTTPTSHILKPLIEDIGESVQNELFCSHLAQRLGLEVPHTEIRWLDSTPYFLIERYDRVYIPGKGILRVHQEDFCQALGILPELKYEREGGPGVDQCLGLLKEYAKRPAVDRLNFIHRLIFNYLIGNCDAHGKNFSLLYGEKQPRLAPAYDLMSTAVYPNLSHKMAMKIGGQYDPDMVVLRYWHTIVPDTAAAKKALNKELMKLARSCQIQALQLKADFTKQGITSPIFDMICAVIQKRCQSILSQF